MRNVNTMVWILTCMFQRSGMDYYVQRMFTGNISIWIIAQNYENKRNWIIMCE